jgi:hypothetical protein
MQRRCLASWFAIACNRQTLSDALQKAVPDRQNMFSVLPNFPSSTIRIEHNDPLPASIPRDYQERQTYKHSDDVAAYSSADPQGRDRYKYRARPLVAAADVSQEQQQRMTFSLVKFAQANNAAAGKAQQVPTEPEAKTRTVFVQTDYRENDTQTDPWTPEYVLRPGSAPEILTLASLSYGMVHRCVRCASHLI